ncbi:MAG: glycosyltransferase family 39 protein [Planctomycetaceae bacterium]|nr:glycosyltransferase family 39 protein [Planctomycetaceae bacterium]
MPDTTGHHSPVVRRLAELAVLWTLFGMIWFMSGSLDLLTRSFWMDEVHTWLLVNDSDPIHAFQALRHGVDFNPPAYYLAARTLRLLPGNLTELRLRLFSAGLMLLALSGCYLILRRRVSFLSAAIAMLLVSGHPVVIHQCFEARFYAMWMACLVWLVWILDRSDRRLSRGEFIGSLILGVLVCTCHYFGIISVLLVTTFQIHKARGTRNRDGRMRQLLVLVAVSLASVGLCLPLLMGQREALSCATWVSAPTVDTSIAFLQSLLLPSVLMGLVFLAVLSNLKTDRLFPASLDAAGLVPLCLMPVALLVMSWTLQPTMVLRYGIAGAFGLAPVYSGLISRISPILRNVLLLTVIGWCVMSSKHCTEQWTAAERRHIAVERFADEQPPDRLIVMEDRIDWMPLIHRRPDLSGRCRLIDFDESQLPVPSCLRIVQRDVGRQVARWYPGMQLQPIAQLNEEDEFAMLPYPGGAADDIRYPKGFETHTSDGIGWLFRRFSSARAGDSVPMNRAAIESGKLF